MLKRILLAYDGSALADKAYQFAVDIAKKYDADIYALAVARFPELGDNLETEAVIETENSRRHYQKVMASLKAQATSLGARLHFVIVVGHPADEIIRHAEQFGVELIVLGHGGKSLFERLRLGSVSKQVIRYAHCSVTVVR